MLVIDTIRTIGLHVPHAAEPGAPSLTRVESASGVDALIDNSQPYAKVWLEILEERRQHGDLVFLEISDESRQVLRFLLPFRDRVAALFGGKEEVLIALEMFEAIRHLNRSHPRFSHFYELLEAARAQRAPVIITDDPETHEIVDVRLAPPVAEGERGPKSDAAAIAPAATAPPEISMDLAVEMFQTVSAQTCYPLTPTDSCNPFLYPDEGCWVRAHQMKRVIEQKTGIQVWKSWNYGGFATEVLPLKLKTRNHPNCLVKWKYHVAPLVTVTGYGFCVLDPSIFSHIVTQKAWKDVQQYDKSILVNTVGDVFNREFTRESDPEKITYDPSYLLTDGYLRYFRDKLKLRSAEKGPPPYSHCPV